MNTHNAHTHTHNVCPRSKYQHTNRAHALHSPNITEKRGENDNIDDDGDDDDDNRNSDDKK